MASKTTISKSTILEIQRSLCSSLDSSMIIEISSDNTIIFISNITPETFVNLKLVSNNPSFGTYYFFMNLYVFIGDSLLPTKILGLDQIIESKIRSSDLNSFIDNKTTHTPFLNGFRNGLTINQLINRLSLLSSLTPDVPLDAKLRFTLVMDPYKKKRFWKKVASHPLTSMAADYFKDVSFDIAGRGGGPDPTFTNNEDDAMDGGD